MKYLSQEKFDRLQKLIESVIAVYAQARETQENKNCVPGFDMASFLGEKEIYFLDKENPDPELWKMLKFHELIYDMKPYDA